MARKQKRFRSNLFQPKVKRPLSFELTKLGHARKEAAMNRCQASLGDVVEALFALSGDQLTPELLTEIVASYEAGRKRRKVVAKLAQPAA